MESGSKTRVKAVLYPGKDDVGKDTATALPIQAVAASPQAAATPAPSRP